ncbi:hypothetical protein [Prevotella sp. P6B1]|uniref:hypothetical protein n=1 Tax=Prevotella sp. P6B1 TaxID=1410613 RepID=UPI00051BDF84|nr:hypothetical protein [Prevotella sp. P6B1]
MIKSRAYIINITICLGVLFLASCGKQHTAEQTVKDFVAQNMQEGVETSGYDFADLGTTRHINDSLVAEMRKKGADLFKSGIQYDKAPQGDMFYLRMRYLYKGDTLQNTFYLDSTLTHVVAFK